MQAIDTLIHAEWIIPIEPDETILENHAVAIHDGLILELLTSEQARAKYSATQSFDLERHV
ncbi:MAG: TRZ/ATZ family hydrolase, partial [Gammaproteobacteria bacterium]|nr:TRZ/ATZ family hydrolase [Gammaproteobacteria bacterium]